MGYRGFREQRGKTQAFERLRAFIEAVVLTPEDGDLQIYAASLFRWCRHAPEHKRRKPPRVFPRRRCK